MRLKLPNHLALILDGNRRWARKRGLPPWAGHRAGAENLEKILNVCLELGIPHISVYVLSTENLNRSKKEVQEIFKILSEYLEKWERGEAGFLDKYEVKVRFVGDLNKLPKKLVRIMGKIMQKTAKYQRRVLNLLVAYGSRFELVQTIKKIVEKAIKSGKLEISEKDIEANLLVPVPVDLIIRTGGYSRLSNFLLYQAAYAEIYVTKVLWPDFNKKELIKAIKWFNSVNRKFGR